VDHANLLHDQIGLGWELEANSTVRFALEQVDRAVVNEPLHAQARALVHERIEPGGEDLVREYVGCRDPQLAPGLRRLMFGGVDETLNAIVCVVRLIEESLTGRRQSQTPSRAFEQTDPQVGLESRHMPTECGLAETEASRVTSAARARHQNEALDPVPRGAVRHGSIP